MSVAGSITDMADNVIHTEKWMMCNKTADFELIEKSFGVSPVTSRLLVNRGQDTIEKVQKYLFPTEKIFNDAHLLKDVGKACEIIYEKLMSKSRIRIIGDYDVDGVVSTFVLTDVLGRLGGVVDYRIPERIKDGYGLNIALIDEAYDDGIDTIVTCDNGIAAREQIAHASELGITVIVTDHHDIPDVLPLAAAVVDPKQTDCPYPEKGICGAVVALKLLEVLVGDLCSGDMKRGVLTKGRTVMEQYLQYAAIATVCDVCSLEDENRAIVKLGIEQLRQTDDVGISALIDECGVNRETICAYHLGYIMGPCFNAAGRLSVADKALSLLCAKTHGQAQECAHECVALNEERKSMTKEWLDRAIAMCEQEGFDRDMVIVLYLKGCHESLTGIIAGRLKEKYNRPSIVLTNGANEVKGSGRSIEGYHMFEEINRCGSLLIKYGGHPMAAGMSLLPQNVEPFRQALLKNCTLSEESIVPRMLLDAVVPLGMLNEHVISELDMLEPFGSGNAKPVFAERDLEVCQAYSIGRKTQYFKFRLRNAYGSECTALYFGNYDELERRITEKYGSSELRAMFAGRQNKVRFTVAYYPQINEYMGNRSIQIVLQSIKL